ncbi:MAG: hypothetical protein MJK04_16200, partial [Psychrosphaera sp.]|nr:hypothetical protein [Psychrosphaera sp.]
KKIDAQYQNLFALLPCGAENDQALLDMVLATDDMLWADASREAITAANVDQWCDDLIHGASAKRDIAKYRLQFYFGGPRPFEIYFAKHVALMEMKNNVQTRNLPV